ncbi:uncharacterized protein LOC125224994 isoform X1 [Leguminivora glycinivorella]|uniref:uncharacterized protein LOC125224994 isoform X1 n=1 Tax=Leguminivora glycinivorella TaxID=1035111 RepID=UPI00200F0C5C|nr:uncharacterized protein LOC125224994 isoform X1 [Leguminivora glycinivorella]
MILIKCAVFAILHFVSAQNEILTGDNVNYQFFPLKNRKYSAVSFKVDARNDAHVALSTHPLTFPMYEFIIGGWGNTKSAIQKQTCPPLQRDEAETLGILNGQEYRGFWIRWDTGNILVGRRGEDKPFISYQDPKPFRAKFAGVRTSYGADGNWKLANGSRHDGRNEQSIDVTTLNDATAQYFPVSGSAVHFKVRAPNDAMIELTSQARQTDPMYEIIIGGWSNKKSVIRKHVCNILQKDEAQTPQILNNKEFREFWLQWDNGNVLVGREGEAAPFLVWQDPDPMTVAYVGVRTTLGSTGNWVLASGSNKGGDSIDVATPNDEKWQFFPIMGDSLTIKVRASNDANIGLSSHPRETDPLYEVILGGWSNTKSVIRKHCCMNPDKAVSQTNGILNSGESRGFWLNWDKGNFMAGREGETNPFILWQDPDPAPVAFIGVHTGFGSTGVWDIENVSAKDVIVSNSNETISKPAVCAATLTRLRHGDACAGQTVFEENFDYLRHDIWEVQHYVPVDHPELPFVSYQRSTVSVTNGYLRIAPSLQQNQPGFTHSSMFEALNLYKGCTSGQSSSCHLEASDGSSVIPPVIGGRISSRSSFGFTYGIISIRAKLPQGDWLYPEILLESSSKKFVYGTKNSGMLKIACARGNKELMKGSTQYGNKVLYSGPVIDTKCHDSLLVTQTSHKFWGDGFHVYSLKWTPDNLIFSVDGKEYASVESDSDGLRARLPKTCAGPHEADLAPFDNHFFITLGLAAGGHTEFPDGCVTKDNHPKPWKNQASKATLNFWKDSDVWQDTWERPEMLIDYVKVVAL